MNQSNYFDRSYQIRLSLPQYTARTFGWMFLGLLVTFFTALATFFTGLFQYTAAGMMPFLLALCEVAVVIWLSAKLHTLSISAARILFFTYAVLNGVTFASLLLYYNLYSMIFAFGMAAAFFGIMALYGYLTKADLSQIRLVLVGGLIVLLMFSLLFLFLRVSLLNTVLSIFGVLLFVGYTAYDTQKIRTNYYFFQGNQVMLEKASIISALQLYLDFINIFLYLLRLFGRSRD